MNPAERQKILEQAAEWFRTVIIPNHLKNTEKLISAKNFDINPFLTTYLATFFNGEVSPESIARALLYPRVIGTSITTSFGSNMQNFISSVLKDSFGSMTTGIDIEFIDSIDGRRKYCQVKLGPNTINKDDVKTIHDHFKGARNLGKTNNINVALDDMVVAILYGETGQESAHYKKLNSEYGYPVWIGADFWHRLTGDKDFYADLLKSIANVATELNTANILESTVVSLSKTKEVQALAKLVPVKEKEAE